MWNPGRGAAKMLSPNGWKRRNLIAERGPGERRIHPTEPIQAGIAYCGCGA